MISQLPPLAAEKDAVFVHDYFNSWTSTMFIGNELRLFAFEALLFCTVDMALRNVSKGSHAKQYKHIEFLVLIARIFPSTGHELCLDNICCCYVLVMGPPTHGGE